MSRVQRGGKKNSVIYAGGQNISQNIKLVRPTEHLSSGGWVGFLNAESNFKSSLY